MEFDRSMTPAVRAAIDVAVWFLDRARVEDSHLPFQKLQRLLYFAQSHFAAEFGGMLMPAIFLAEDGGPVEPNLQRLLADGRPDGVVAETLIGRVRDFLGSVWDRYAHMPVERLNDLVAKNKAYVETSRGHIIDIAAMAAAVTVVAPPPQQSVRVLRTQSGAPVTVRAWTPTVTAAKPKA